MRRTAKLGGVRCALFFHLPGILLLTTLAVCQGSSGEMDVLRQEFLNPPASARPWVYWFWIDGNVTRTGITADIEAMRRAGIGGLILMDVTQDIPAGPVTFGSPEWHALFTHAANEAARLGVEISVHNAAGYTGSGGPWIPPELAMQKLISTRTNLAGPQQFHGPLPRFAGESATHPVATLAFPTLVGEGGPPAGFSPIITSSAGPSVNSSNLLDGDPATFVTLTGPSGKGREYLQLEFTKPFTASILKLIGPPQPQPVHGVLEVSQNGRSFRKVREFLNAKSDLNLAFEQVEARFFRVVFNEADPGVTQLKFSEIELSPQYPIPLFQTKAGLGPLPPQAAHAIIPRVPAEAIIKPDSIVDLTARTDTAGNLNWDVPRGKWTVLRLGHAPVGTLNHPARPGGEGLESDKLSKVATDAHFDAFAGRLISEAGAAAKAITALHVDSWEVGYQNWTPSFPEEFQRRRGYDLLKLLPAATGRYVASAEESERFLWDVRQTIAELVADNYAGELCKLAHGKGLALSVESYASLGSGPFNELTYGAPADLPMAEFWLEGNDYSTTDLHAMPSIAHTSGKQIVPAEAFTSYPADSGWREHPFILKPLADVAFCEGVNRLVIHRYAHQPWLHSRPGMTMGNLGVHYERTQTWWEQSREWHAYLARCQHLLQQGLFVAELCYMTREGAYRKAPVRGDLTPSPPAGYSYDLVDPQVVLERMSVRNGRLVLPDGMSYGALILPESETMTPKLLRKLKVLVDSGATIVGRPPKRSPSLQDYPSCDQEIAELSHELWRNCDGRTVTENRSGKGKVVWGRSLKAVLTESGLAPDLEVIAGGSESSRSKLPSAMRWIHRRAAGRDLYFLANPTQTPLTFEGHFRVSNKTPEYWHPDTGLIERPALWRRDTGRIILPLTMEPADSLFVVFSRDTEPIDPVITIARNGRAEAGAKVAFDPAGKLEIEAASAGSYRVQTETGKSYAANFKALPAPINVTGKWQLDFPAHSGAPGTITLDGLRSWSTHPAPGIRYFSGTATYFKNVGLPENLFGAGRKIFLNLGRVQVIAEVSVNGRNCGVLWKPPFETEISRSAHPGDNELVVKVTNLWPNRLIGDEQLPADCNWREPAGSDTLIAEWPQWLQEGKSSPAQRLTFTTWHYWTKDSPLLESGLLGPVAIRVVDRAPLR